MKRTALQFGSTHLLTLVTMIAITIALFRWHVVAGILGTPILIGPVAGVIVVRFRRGAIIGLLSAVYWSIIASFTAIIISIVVASVVSFPDPSLVAVAIGFYIVILMSSAIGGYVGGRVAASAS